MANTYTVGIVSDIHFASAAEQARGNDYEWRDVTNPLLRFLIRFYRRHLWLRDPLNKNHLLDRFLERSNGFDYLIANGDYAVNTSCFGLSDDAALQGATECIEKLRQKFGDKLRLNIGDHELGKLSIVGGRGGMRLASWQRAIQQLKLEPFWQLQLGNYVLLNVVSYSSHFRLSKPTPAPPNARNGRSCGPLTSTRSVRHSTRSSRPSASSFSATIPPPFPFFGRRNLCAPVSHNLSKPSLVISTRILSSGKAAYLPESLESLFSGTPQKNSAQPCAKLGIGAFSASAFAPPWPELNCSKMVAI